MEYTRLTDTVNAQEGRAYITKNGKNRRLFELSKLSANVEIKTKTKQMLGNRVEVGCNSVLNPGTVIGPDSNVYPTSCVRGVIPANHVYKDKDHIIAKK